MSIFQFRRGVAHKSMICGTKIQAGPFNGGRFDFPVKHPDKEALQGYVLKIPCFEFRWKYPWSAVWLESSIAFMWGELRFVLLRKRFRQATPDPKIITQEQKLLETTLSTGHVDRPTNLKAPFWGAFTKWKSEGMPDAWSDHSGLGRAAATLEKINPRGADSEDGFERIVKAMKKAKESKKDGGTARAAEALDNIQDRQVERLDKPNE